MLALTKMKPRRSKKETERLFGLSKVPYQTREVKIESNHQQTLDIDSNEWSSGMEDLDEEEEDSKVSEENDTGASSSSSLEDSDEEQSYERRPRIKESKELQRKSVPRLPIKLPGGQVQQTGVREGSVESDEEMEDTPQPSQAYEPPKRDVAGARFGRAAIVDIVRIKSREERLKAAKEQIAGICQDILSEPELGVSLMAKSISCTAYIVPS